MLGANPGDDQLENKMSALLSALNANRESTGGKDTWAGKPPVADLDALVEAEEKRKKQEHEEDLSVVQVKTTAGAGSTPEFEADSVEAYMAEYITALRKHRAAEATEEKEAREELEKQQQAAAATSGGTLHTFTGKQLGLDGTGMGGDDDDEFVVEVMTASKPKATATATASSGSAKAEGGALPEPKSKEQYDTMSLGDLAAELETVMLAQGGAKKAE